MTVRILHLFILFCFLHSGFVFSIPIENQTIVPTYSQINDNEAKLNLIRILSRQKESEEKALTFYKKLLNDEDIDFNQVDLSKINWEKQGETANTIVPIYSQVSDAETLLSLARIYARHENTKTLALNLYEALLKNDPENSEVILETGALYISLKKYEEGLKLLYNALEKNPCNLKLLIATAQGELAFGHAENSLLLFLKAIKHPDADLNTLITFADAMMVWGDFFEAEKIYKIALDRRPCSLDLHLKLAWTMVSVDRFEEAEQLYLSLLLDYPNHPKVIEALANLKTQQKNYPAALEYVNQLICLNPSNSQFLQLKGYLLYMEKFYEEAIEIYEQFKDDPKYALYAYIGIGKSYERLCKKEEAFNAFEIAFLLNTKSIEAQYYYFGNEVLECDFLEDLIQSSLTSEELQQWAIQYVQNGFVGQALILFQAAVDKDAQNFSAQIGLAESLSNLFHFKAALKIYNGLMKIFPQNAKLMLSKARILGWSKNYDASIDYYDKIISITPCNPNLYREKARTAIWGKSFDLAMYTYKQLICEPVDLLLLNKLSALKCEAATNRFLESLDTLETRIHFGSIYEGYEEFFCRFCENEDESCSIEKILIERILVELYGDYLIQKSISLEIQAKTLTWNKYYIHSLPALERFLELRPGDEEMLFDKAESNCILGLCNEAKQIYEEILHIDPSHSLIKRAFRRNELKQHPLIQETFSYWREVGRDTFAQSQIARFRSDTVYDQPISCRSHLRLIQNVYVENPFYNFKYYPAQGQTLEWSYVINPYFQWSQNVGYRTFFHEFKSTWTAHNRLYANANDYFHLIASYDREDIIYNFFSLDQATQADITSLTLFSYLNRYLTLGGAFQLYHYNDHNQQVHYNINAEYQLTDEPNVFKLIFNGGYRNTAHDSIFIFDGPSLVNIIHPYWTPINYYYTSLTLQCRHDYRYFQFCEAPQKYIDVKVSGGTDSVDNPFIQGIIEWKHEFETHFGIELKGFIHRSREWNAEGGWATLYYRF